MTILNQPNDFTRDYLASWITPDAGERNAIIARIWSPEGTLSVSSLGITLEGAAAITEHIGRVHDDLIATKGLTFSYDQEVTSGDTLLLRWSMTTPAGDVVGRGADTVQFAADHKIASANMFMGVN